LTEAAGLPLPSRRLLAAARPYLRHYTARHFSSLRIASDGPAPELAAPTVFYCNHPSWWDPIVLILLIRTHYPDWRFHGPIDADALRRYPWLERLGLFALEPGTPAGARRLLAAGRQLLAEPRAGLVLTAQGGFTDVRRRPVTIRRGLARLLRDNPQAEAIPLAIEYVFWNERLPEILVRFGQRPLTAAGRPADEIQIDLEQALEHQLDRLARAATARDPDQFECLLTGRRGVGMLQDLPLRLKALFTGRRFDPAHSAIGRDRERRQ